jgi:hypothetical protein
MMKFFWVLADASTGEYTQRQNTEHQHPRRRENLKSDINICLVGNQTLISSP